jgi:hypothetical protein
MALSGNFRRKLGSQDKAPVLKAAVRHGDVIHLPGQRVPERYSRAKIRMLKQRGYID